MSRDSLVVLVAACALACGSKGTTGFNQDPPSQDPSGGGRSGGNSPTLGGNSGTSGNGGDTTQGCSSAAKLIYVIDDHGALHSFDPSLLPTPTAFKTIGTPTCSWGADPLTGAAAPNSMAIDRNAVAWVCDTAGNLFKVNTTDASCEPASFQAGQQGFGKFGMGFSSDTAGGSTDTLYISGTASSPFARDSKGTAKVDLSTMKLTLIGPLDQGLDGLDAELTGTGDGRLFGFVFSQPSSLIGIDKGSGHVLSIDTVPVSVNPFGLGNLAWAFSFWGGVFYLYTADTSKAPFSNVTEYDPAAKKSTTVLSQIGFNIVGAGVSTCAPTAPVR
jgi:hypothetical protein